MDGEIAFSSRNIEEFRKKYNKIFRETMKFRGKGRKAKYETPFIKKVLPKDEDPEIMDVYKGI